MEDMMENLAIGGGEDEEVLLPGFVDSNSTDNEVSLNENETHEDDETMLDNNAEKKRKRLLKKYKYL
ncbi:hypothetical protein M5689_019808 [Euphorbia peplus]|nr:hypothetical protein M5689_019808 [Euphorbia peplus]